MNVDQLEPAVLDKVSIVLSPDGCCIVLCIPGSPPSLISMHTMSITDRLDGAASSGSLAGVFSPNGVCFAEVVDMDALYKLQIWSLSEVSVGSTGSFENPKSLCSWDSMRLAWSMLSNADPWDICQRIQRHTKTVPDQLMYFSLFYMDRMLHRHPHLTRPQYADMLDKIKIRILKDTQDPTLQVGPC